jgi:hypothetical protein
MAAATWHYDDAIDRAVMLPFVVSMTSMLPIAIDMAAMLTIDVDMAAIFDTPYTNESVWMLVILHV